MAFHISVAKRYDRADPIKSLCPETRLADIDAIWLFYRSNSRKWVSFRHCSVTARDVALPRNIAAEPKEHAGGEQNSCRRQPGARPQGYLSAKA
jgi:hypothetical protein